MADIRPFRGFRYDLAKAGPLSGVVAPPYDVIDPPLHAALLAAGEYNAVRLEVPGDPADPAVDKYTAAARVLNGWLADGVVRQDTARSLYVLEQEFTADAVTRVRRGFLARVRVEPLGTGRIFPHEQTLAGPKADRLKLYQATGFNVSPVFGLYPDPDNAVFAELARFVRTAPPLTAVDHLGTTHRLWVVTDQAATSHVVGLMGPKPVFLADGHHRYETALKYRDEQVAAGRADPDDAACNFCLMHLVSMGDPGLVIQPTHRMLSGLPAGTAAELKALLASHFAVVADYPGDPAGCWDHVQMDGSQSVLGFLTPDGGAFVAELTDPAAMDALTADHGPAWRGLGVSILHRLVIDTLLPGGPAAACAYGHQLAEVTAALDAGTCQLGVLVPAADMGHVEAVAGGRETMPPKSTYFFPKVPTGLVFNSLKRD